MIIDEIVKIKKDNNDSMLKLIEKFNPILKKYSYRLYYEDAYNDLLLDFIELLIIMSTKKIRNTEDGCLVSYITNSIHNSYIKKLIKIKHLKNFTMYSDLSESELYYIDSITATNDIYENTDIDTLKKFLTNPEFITIKMIFYEGYSVIEIASFLGISRQAVNQMKNRALKKLKIMVGQVTN